MNDIMAGARIQNVIPRAAGQSVIAAHSGHIHAAAVPGHHIGPDRAHDMAKGDAVCVRIGWRAIIGAGVVKTDCAHIALFLHRPGRHIDHHGIAPVQPAMEIDVTVGQGHMHIIAGGRGIAGKQHGVAGIDRLQAGKGTIGNVAQPEPIAIAAVTLVMRAGHGHVGEHPVDGFAQHQPVRSRLHYCDIAQNRADRAIHHDHHPTIFTGDGVGETRLVRQAIITAKGYPLHRHIADHLDDFNRRKVRRKIKRHSAIKADRVAVHRRHHGKPGAQRFVLPPKRITNFGKQRRIVGLFQPDHIPRLHPVTCLHRQLPRTLRRIRHNPHRIIRHLGVKRRTNRQGRFPQQTGISDDHNLALTFQGYAAAVYFHGFGEAVSAFLQHNPGAVRGAVDDVLQGIGRCACLNQNNRHRCAAPLDFDLITTLGCVVFVFWLAGRARMWWHHGDLKKHRNLRCATALSRFSIVPARSAKNNAVMTDAGDRFLKATGGGGDGRTP